MQSPCRDRPAARIAVLLKFRRRCADKNAMSHDLLNRIEQSTRLAGHNRLALLLFRNRELGGAEG